MKCRSCGFEIADKAIVCYRCGTPTAETASRPVAPPSRPRWTALAMVVMLAALASWFVLQTAPGSLERMTAWCGLVLVLVGGATVALRRGGAGKGRIR